MHLAALLPASTTWSSIHLRGFVATPPRQASICLAASGYPGFESLTAYFNRVLKAALTCYVVFLSGRVFPRHLHSLLYASGQCELASGCPLALWSMQGRRGRTSLANRSMSGSANRWARATYLPAMCVNSSGKSSTLLSGGLILASRRYRYGNNYLPDTYQARVR